MHQKNIALYIHWPWCKHKCPYCDFNSHVQNNPEEETYKNLLIKELKYNSKNVSNYILTSVFFGGGTPSLMSEKTLNEIIETIFSEFQISEDIEITLEANPTSSEAEKFAHFTRSGINRFSIGVQSLESADLKFLGREHNLKEALNAVEMALKNTPNVNLDLIYGLPGQNINKWEQNLQHLLDIGTTHLSAYQLTVEPNTQLYKSVIKGDVKELNPDIQFDFYQSTCQILEKNGYNQYEVSNFSKPQYECKHNLHIWQYKPYIGIGAGAHGRLFMDDKIIATNTYKMPKTYIEKTSENRHGYFQEKPLSVKEITEECIMMSLRLKEGIDKEHLDALTQKNWKKHINNKALERLKLLNFVKETPKRIFLTTEGQQVLDGILAEILEL